MKLVLFGATGVTAPGTVDPPILVAFVRDGTTIFAVRRS
jgi:hypothetical protein